MADMAHRETATRFAQTTSWRPRDFVPGPNSKDFVLWTPDTGDYPCEPQGEDFSPSPASLPQPGTALSPVGDPQFRRPRMHHSYKWRTIAEGTKKDSCPSVCCCVKRPLTCKPSSSRSPLPHRVGTHNLCVMGQNVYSNSRVSCALLGDLGVFLGLRVLDNHDCWSVCGRIISFGDLLRCDRVPCFSRSDRPCEVLLV